MFVSLLNKSKLVVGAPHRLGPPHRNRGVCNIPGASVSLLSHRWRDVGIGGGHQFHSKEVALVLVNSVPLLL